MKSSKQLVQDAKDYRFNPAIPLRIYLKTCIGILEKAQCAFQANDLSLSFIYYFRYVDLLTNKLSRHLSFCAWMRRRHRRHRIFIKENTCNS